MISTTAGIDMVVNWNFTHYTNSDEYNVIVLLDACLL